jgi:hypothetical protein
MQLGHSKDHRPDLPQREVTWTERVQVVQSVAQQDSQKARLEND